MSDQRNLLGDAVSALVVLLGLDVATLPEEPAAMRSALQRAALEASVAWERDANGTRDHDAATRARRWARAVEAAWELARHELDVASGRRRSGWAA